MYTHVQLLELSPIANTKRAAPEAEFIKRGRKPAGAEATAVESLSASSSPAPPKSKAAAKAEFEAERKELLKGLDAVMQDLQRRAEEKASSASTSSKSRNKAAAREEVNNE